MVDTATDNRQTSWWGASRRIFVTFCGYIRLHYCFISTPQMSLNIAAYKVFLVCCHDVICR